MDTMELLVTLDENYLPPLQVLITSLRTAHPAGGLRLHLVHGGIPAQKLEAVARQCRGWGIGFACHRVDPDLFRDAPVTKQYPQAMYYRLLAHCILPRDLDRVLYLDPDILALNPLDELWRLDLAGRIFAAAAHSSGGSLIGNINQVRLGTESAYFNSGVLLIDLAAARREVRPAEVFGYVAGHAKELLLPDQDVLNALYGGRILPLDDAVWNYDARYYSAYLVRSGGVQDMDWVMAHTALLHFCGRAKPWRARYAHRFGALYKHYIQLTRRTGLYLGQ